MIRRAALLLIALAAPTCLSGCTIAYGVNRTARLASLPTAGEVEAALSEVPGVVGVEHRRLNDSKWDTYDQFIFRSKRFVYRGADGGGVVEVHPGAGGGATLRLYSYWLNHRPPPHVIKQVRAVMDEVYGHLAARLKVLPPAGEVQEELLRVQSD